MLGLPNLFGGGKKAVSPQLSQQESQWAKTLSAGVVSVRDIIAPPAIEVDFDYIKVGSTYFRTLFVIGYPRFVQANWLAPLVNFEHTLEIALYSYPVEAKGVLDDLKRKITEMEATIATDIQHGHVIDPAVQAALEDAEVLQEELVKGAERFFQFGLYVTIPADSKEELDTITKQVESTLGSLLLVPKHATLQQEDAFKTTLPQGTDHIYITRNMDTTSLATTFPYISSSLTSNTGIMYGVNEHNGSLVIFDRFSQENANSVVFSKSGGGKSIPYSETIFYRDQSGVKLGKIGPIVEDLIAKNGTTQIDDEMEGIVLPGLQVWTFDKDLKGQWSNVTVAARKKFSPRNRLYKITTKSGRQITVTADHSMVVLRNGKIRAMRSEAIKIGESVPITRGIEEPKATPLSIKPRDFVPIWPDDLHQHLLLDKPFLSLLGFITSEGHITPKTLQVYNLDAEVVGLINKYAADLNLILSPRYGSNKNVKGFYFKPLAFARLVIALGGGGLSGEKRVPNIMFSLSNEQVAHYIRAYMEGDGGVEHDSVCATTKSEQLASDLAYLFLRFGIVVRIHQKQKFATNTVNKTVGTYWQITISGRDNLQKFAKDIGFLTVSKNTKLRNLLEKRLLANTNVDTIPTLMPIFDYLYKSLFSSSELPSPQNLSPLKREIFAPSRGQLKLFIEACEKRIAELRDTNEHVKFLRNLPSTTDIIRRGSANRKLNKKLWQDLGDSWRIMKNSIYPPLATNALRAYETISGQKITLPEVNYALYHSFRQQGVSMADFDRSLWSSIVVRKTGNSSFPTILRASTFITKKYRSTQLKIRHAEEKLAQLKLLANSDLFWDPITSIERVKHKEQYVYDLQVDNGVFLAGTGGMFVHNSYLVKLEALRSLMFGTEIIVIDPEEEYKNLCSAIGGEYITFDFNSDNKINPFDLSGVYEEGENELGLKILSLHGFFKVIMGSMTPSEDALLDRALVATYKSKGITPDPATQKNEPPLMEDLYKVLLGMEDVNAKGLADRIEKFVKGSLVGIFNQQSNIDIKNTFTVFSIKNLENEMRPIAMYLILDFIWTRIKNDLRKRLLIVDEAWYLMQYPDSASFMYSIAKRARKYYLGLTTITQDVEDFLATDYGRAIVTNSSIQILLKQSPAAIDRVADAFYLSEGEKHLLLSADVGEGIFFAGPNHVAIRIVASEDEHYLVTSNPAEILERQQQQQQNQG